MRNKAFIPLTFISILWGINYPISAFLLQSFSPVFLSTIRISCTSIILILIAISQKGIRRPTVTEWKLLLGAGIFGTLINQIFFFTGLQHTTSANASLIIALAPITTIFLERIVFKEKLTYKKIIGAMISLVGVFSIIGITSRSLEISWGDLNILIAMFSLSISILFIRALSKNMNSFFITVFATVLGSLFMIPAAGVEAIISETVISYSILLWLLLISSAIITQGMAGFLWNKSVGEVGAGTASMFMNIPPFVAILAAYFILGDPILARQIVGGLLVLFGVYIANKPSGKHEIVLKPSKSV